MKRGNLQKKEKHRIDFVETEDIAEIVREAWRASSLGQKMICEGVCKEEGHNDNGILLLFADNRSFKRCSRPLSTSQ